MKTIPENSKKKMIAGRDHFSLGKVVTVGVLIVTFLLSMGYVFISGYE
ncbi:hypothetical protein [Parasegetibacter sp. NRK P23]|nr:hypothetical protein [Parasegetibacter sp. NRK P23]MCM5528227.1 hypothetical protein [Parasegetibacter sp. NRK P23]